MLKSWEAKKARGFLTCFFCGKRRLICSPLTKEYDNARLALQQKLESVGSRYSCGDLIFDDNHHLSKVVVQKQSLTCESQIERAYYINKDRTLKLKNICVHCGEGGLSKFLWTTAELRERNISGGLNYLPICVNCFKKEKKPLVKGPGRKDEQQAKKEKQALKAKSAQA